MRVALPYNVWLLNGAMADVTGLPVTSGTFNGASVPAVAGDRSLPESTVLRVQCGATPGAVIIRAGALPLAISSGLGDLTVNLSANAIQWLGPFESGRFMQTDRTLMVDVTQSMTITAFRIARH